jgi:hypothetical protein
MADDGIAPMALNVLKSSAPTPIMAAFVHVAPKGPARPRRPVTANGGASWAARGLGSATSAGDHAPDRDRGWMADLLSNRQP